MSKLGTEPGKRLVVLRKARGVTQAQLADAVSSSHCAICHGENEAEAPTGHVVAAMASLAAIRLGAAR